MNQQEITFGYATYELCRVFQKEQSLTDLLVEKLEESVISRIEVDDVSSHKL